jgi:tRNA modification GTPase
VEEILEQLKYLESLGIPFLTVVNKQDLVTSEFEDQLLVISDQLSVASDPGNRQQATDNILCISAKNKTGIEELKSEILRKVNLHSINTDDVLVSNIRHLEALQKTEESLKRVLQNIDQPITSDFLASDIKQALYYLGEITGQVTTDDLLETIFSKFCIGK